MATREARAAIAEETLAVLQKGSYETRGGRGQRRQRIDLKPFLQHAIGSTTLHPAAEPSLLPGVLQILPGLIEVSRETTLQAGQRLHSELGAGASSLCILNFASARNPGGGFRKGSQAQEESLARSSGLVACLEAHHNDFYMPHRKDPQDGLYSHLMLHSPNVPFFREDQGSFCPLWCASVITSPAPNANLSAPRHGKVAVDNIMMERCYHILRLARDQGHSDLVLGAFGCGVFGNDPKHVAACFYNLLCDGGELAGHFHRIVFAIPGHQDDINFEAFRTQFSSVEVAQGTTCARSLPEDADAKLGSCHEDPWAKASYDKKTTTSKHEGVSTCSEETQVDSMATLGGSLLEDVATEDEDC